MQYPYSKFYISSELPKITTVNETVSVFSSAILTCKASGDPPPEISWILSNNTRVRNVVCCKHEYKLWMKKCAFPLTNGFFGFKARAYI